MPSDNPTTLQEGNVPSLLEAGRLDDALQAATTTLQDARLAAEEDAAHLPLLVNALESLAEVHRQIGDFEKAESMYQEALETAEWAKAAPHQMVRLRTGLATLYDFNQREELAISLYEAAIEDYDRMDPPRDQESAQVRNNLAMIYKSLGRFPLAEQHYLMALETLEKLHGRNDERVAAVFNNLGSLYYTAGFGEQAKEMHLEALDIRVHVFGPDHPEVAQSYCNLATACYELQDDVGTQQNYEKSLRIFEQNFSTCADAYEEVGTDYVAVLEAMGEDKKAETLKKRMAKLLRK